MFAMSRSVIAPTAYELYDPNTVTSIDYLYTTTTNLDLSRYNGLHIIVTGEEGLAERWNQTRPSSRSNAFWWFPDNPMPSPDSNPSARAPGTIH